MHFKNFQVSDFMIEYFIIPISFKWVSINFLFLNIQWKPKIEHDKRKFKQNNTLLFIQITFT